MMNSKSQMADWILDFFRRNNCRANEIVMFPTVMFAVGKLNPKEKDLFTNVANELISHGYMTFEQKPVQCVRLTAKGEEYIYNQDAILDCCVDKRKPTEEIFRDIITLGQTVSTLQTYQDVLQRGELAENLQLLVTQLENHQRMRQLRIETIKEYYGCLYRFFFYSCQMLTLLDDESLRDVIFGYIETVEGILKKEATIQRASMIQQMSDMYIKASNTAMSDDNRQKLQNLKRLLFI